MRVRTHTNPLSINHRFDDVNLPESITENTPLDLEIGFGRGVFLRHWAKENPKNHIVGIEVRKPLVTLLNQRLDNEKINNASVYHGNGHVFLEDVIEDYRLNSIFVFHPDPWFKKRHHKRRVIHTEFLDLASKKLKTEGKLYISTDVKDLFTEIQSTLNEHPDFQHSPKDSEFWDTHYKTHWDDFSQTDKRRRYCGTFTKKTTPSP